MYFHGVRSRVDVWHARGRPRAQNSFRDGSICADRCIRKRKKQTVKWSTGSVSSAKSVAFPAPNLHLPGCSANRLSLRRLWALPNRIILPMRSPPYRCGLHPKRLRRSKNHTRRTRYSVSAKLLACYPQHAVSTEQCWRDWRERTERPTFEGVHNRRDPR